MVIARHLALIAGAGLAAANGSGGIAATLIGIALVNLWLRKTTTSPISLAPHPLAGRRERQMV